MNWKTALDSYITQTIPFAQPCVMAFDLSYWGVISLAIHNASMFRRLNRYPVPTDKVPCGWKVHELFASTVVCLQEWSDIEQSDGQLSWRRFRQSVRDARTYLKTQDQHANQRMA